MIERVRHAVQTRYLAFWTRTSTADICADLGLAVAPGTREWRAVAGALRLLAHEGLLRSWGAGEWELLEQR